MKFASVEQGMDSFSSRPLEKVLYYQTIPRSLYHRSRRGICTEEVWAYPYPKLLHITCVLVGYLLGKITFLQAPPTHDAVLPTVVSVSEVYSEVFHVPKYNNRKWEKECSHSMRGGGGGGGLTMPHTPNSLSFRQKIAGDGSCLKKFNV